MNVNVTLTSVHSVSTGVFVITDVAIFFVSSEPNVTGFVRECGAGG
ncbi:hypothetical protein GBF38_023270, partial [Nibea albiflora]